LTRPLEFYGKASGRKLNKEKISIFFSRNTSSVDKQKILKLSGILATQRFDKYLGLSALIGKSRTRDFKSIKYRVWNRLQDVLEVGIFIFDGEGNSFEGGNPSNSNI
jgi:hypothetical protein